MANMTKVTPENQARFLEVICETGNITRAAAEIGVSRWTMYRHREADPEFRAAWEDAVKLGVAALEDEARRRAQEGWEEPVFYQGQECGRIRRFSDVLLIFLLKAHDPAKYREKVDLTHASPNGGPVAVTTTGSVAVELVDAAEAARRYRELMDAPG